MTADPTTAITAAQALLAQSLQRAEAKRTEAHAILSREDIPLADKAQLRASLLELDRYEAKVIEALADLQSLVGGRAS